MKIESKKTILEFDKGSIDSYEIVKKKFKALGKEPANLDLFMFAMTYGFMHSNKVDSVTRSGTGVRVEYLKPEHELLMSAIQYQEEEIVETLLNQESRYELAECYAEGGIRLLRVAVEGSGEFLEDLAGDMSQIFSSIKEEE